MRMICDCGTEMEYVADKAGDPEFWFPVVSITFMGLKRFEGSGFFFCCPDKKCNKAVVVIPK